jgi:CheY-like chemotaxis protein
VETRACGGDILITDIYMPVVNGLDLLERQARQGCTLDIRNNAVISGELDEPSRERLEKLGCTFFMKPFTLDALTTWLAECEARLALNLPPALQRREESSLVTRGTTPTFPGRRGGESGVGFSHRSLQEVCHPGEGVVPRVQTAGGRDPDARHLPGMRAPRWWVFAPWTYGVPDQYWE